MFVIRPISMKDLDALEGFAYTAALGLTSLPRNRQALEKRIGKSLSSFEKKVATPENEHYQFVLEDLSTGTVGGTCGVSSKTGVSTPNYYYKIDTIHTADSPLPIPKEIPILRVVSYRNGPSEIRALYLAPPYRQGGIGRLLSLGRFLFMAAYPQRFDTTTFAEMRGYIDEDGRCPFWDNIGRRFLDLDFASLMELLAHGRGFIKEIAPQHPLYIHLLTQEAQLAIGAIHENTKPAITMLYQEGFTNTGEIDFFEGGPKISATTATIRSIRESRTATVAKIVRDTDKPSKEHLIGNDRIDFRACMGRVLPFNSSEVTISEDVANALQVAVGDLIRYVPAHQEEKPQ